MHVYMMYSLINNYSEFDFYLEIFYFIINDVHNIEDITMIEPDLFLPSQFIHETVPHMGDEIHHVNKKK